MTETENRELTGKVALVTGGGSGIGAACVDLLARRGASVLVADIDGDAATRVAATVAGAVAVTADICDPDACQDMVRACTEAFGTLDIAVNNAGVARSGPLLADVTPEDWRRVIDINLSGVFYSMRAELPVMLARGAGTIINLASVLGSVATATTSAYVAAKHGVVGVTQAAAVEYGSQGIRVNAVAPGYISTPMMLRSSTATMDDLIARHPQGRIGRPEEVAEIVTFLASPRSSFVNGSLYPVDGGYLAR